MMTPNGSRPTGSLPALVMRTGLIRPVNVDQARRDLDTQHIENITHWATNRPAPDISPPAPPLSPASVVPVPAPPDHPVTAAVALTVAATPPQPLPNAPTSAPPLMPSERHHWHREHRLHPMVHEIRRLHPHANIHGADPALPADAAGRPIAKFAIAANPPKGSATAMAHQLRHAAHALYRSGLSALPAELVGGPLAALMQGGSVELHFQNGVVVKATP